MLLASAIFFGQQERLFDNFSPFRQEKFCFREGLFFVVLFFQSTINEGNYTMKSPKKVFSSLILALAFAASASFAAGPGSTSWVSGNVAGGVSTNHGMGGFSVGYEGGAGTMSYMGTTQVSVEGGAQGMVAGTGGAAGFAGSGAQATQSGHSASVTSGAIAQSVAAVAHGGIAVSGAGAVASGSASTHHGWD
jgi:hypothetical protein